MSTTMTKQTHTPGPWTAVPHYLEKPHHCFLINLGQPEPAPEWEELKANARLIAAAPEMFDALQLALISVQEAQRKFAATEDVMWCNAEEVIVAAIRKAKGSL